MSIAVALKDIVNVSESEVDKATKMLSELGSSMSPFVGKKVADMIVQFFIQGHEFYIIMCDGYDSPILETRYDPETNSVSFEAFREGLALEEDDFQFGYFSRVEFYTDNSDLIRKLDDAGFARCEVAGRNGECPYILDVSHDETCDEDKLAFNGVTKD